MLGGLGQKDKGSQRLWQQTTADKQTSQRCRTDQRVVHAALTLHTVRARRIKIEEIGQVSRPAVDLQGMQDNGSYA